MPSKIETKTQRAKTSKRGSHRSGTVKPSAKPDDHLYLQLVRALKKEIVDGVYPVGSQLPTEDKLRERFSVSRYTVREALRRLRDDNLVSSRQGAGTVVMPGGSSDSYAHDVMSINDLVSWSVGRSFILESMEMIRLDEKLASRIGLAKSSDKWLAVRGFGYLEGVKIPVCWAEYYIHRDFAAVGRLLHRHSGPIFPLIEDMFGQRMTEVHQEIGATLIPAHLAGSLKVKAGTAALEVRRAFKLKNGDIAQVTISTHPASRFRHSMTMRRLRA